ncbi:MBL fold metallo-hydrolase [Pelagibacterium montanilacus]|uniref:MBL fold metallo-hydrolase n=1 Tax=Pelagibacterium montanilacus TaxID=2185280 RepID=UPI000F8DC5E6|nr:MBL fold metallo-hydrolase [Pelagibacterium montanilacus]
MTGEPAERIVATILGCGSSGGVPRIGNVWGACDPANPRNRRRRCSVLLTGTRADSTGATRVVIDTGCDLREQMIDARVSEIDAVLYTHDHADHTHGIDDLRVLALNARSRVDCYMTEPTARRLHEAFGYCFASPADSAYPPILNAHIIADGERMTIDGAGGQIEIAAFEQTHGTITSLGFRIDAFAYSCDLSALPESSEWAVTGLETWVLDALRYSPHPSHLSLEESLALIARHAPRQSVLTNLHIDLDHDILDGETPEHVRPAYDGMEIVIRG